MTSFLSKFFSPLQNEWVCFVLTFAMLSQNMVFAYYEWTWFGVSTYTLMSILYAYVLTVAVYTSRSNVVKVVVYLVMASFCVVNIFLKLNYNSALSPAILLLLAETNTKESSEFLGTLLTKKGVIQIFIASILFLPFIVLAERNRKKLFKLRFFCWAKKYLNYLFGIFILLGTMASFVFMSLFSCKSTVEIESWVDKTQAYAMDNISNLIYSFYFLKVSGDEQKIAIQSSVKSEDTPIYCQESDSLFVVFVVGESFCKWHSSLYGYPLETTPNLKKEQTKGNLFIFQDVCSPYNMTSKSLRNVFSCNSLGLKEQWYDHPFFPYLFKCAGYDVYFWDNQYDPSSKDSWDFSLNSYLHDKQLSKMSYTETNKDKMDFDGDFISNYLPHSTSSEKKSLVIFHLQGQHINYYMRFPHGKGFDHFRKEDIKAIRNENYLDDFRFQLIADYDNATYYNDYVMKDIIDYYRDKNCVLVYLSDHGEEIYDYRDFQSRSHPQKPNKYELKYQFEVPFMIWCSDKYIATHQKEVVSIQQSLNNPLSIDNTCQLLLRLGGIRTKHYRPTLDILSNEYHCPPRIVNDIVNFNITVR